jgi:circadian clock protein KaiB
MTQRRDREPEYDLTLFVSGASDLSARAIGNARDICESHLAGRYSLAVIDVNEDVAAVIRSDVIAAPTLIRNLPLPARRLVGDISDPETVLTALGLRAPPRDGS